MATPPAAAAADFFTVRGLASRKADVPAVARALASPPPLRSRLLQEYGEANRYTILEVIGKGSYGVVCSAIDNTTGAAPLRGPLGRFLSLRAPLASQVSVLRSRKSRTSSRTCRCGPPRRAWAQRQPCAL